MKNISKLLGICQGCDRKKIYNLSEYSGKEEMLKINNVRIDLYNVRGKTHHKWKQKNSTLPKQLKIKAENNGTKANQKK